MFLSIYENEDWCREFLRILVKEDVVDLYQADLNACKNAEERKVVCLKYLKMFDRNWKTDENANVKFILRIHQSDIPKELKVNTLMNEFPELRGEEKLLNRFIDSKVEVLESVSIKTNYPSNCNLLRWDEDTISRCIKKCTTDKKINRYFCQILMIVGGVKYNVWKIGQCDPPGQKKAVEIFERKYPAMYDWTSRACRVIELGQRELLDLERYTENGERSDAYFREQSALLIEDFLV